MYKNFTMGDLAFIREMSFLPGVNLGLQRLLWHKELVGESARKEKERESKRGDIGYCVILGPLNAQKV
jgi:hypothetical protein